MERYKSVSVNGKVRKLHHVVWEQVNGPIPPGYVIHHINGDDHDNRIENLQLMTNEEHLSLHHKLRREDKDPVDATDPKVIHNRELQRKTHAKYRETHKEQIKAYYQAHREEAIARVRAYAKANKESISEKKRIYRDAHREEISAYQKVYREEHHDEKLLSEKAYRESHKEEIAECKKLHYEKNRSAIRDKQRAYYETHKEEAIARATAYYQAHKQEVSARGKIYRAIKAGKPPVVIAQLRKEYEELKTRLRSVQSTAV